MEIQLSFFMLLTTSLHLVFVTKMNNLIPMLLKKYPFQQQQQPQNYLGFDIRKVLGSSDFFMML